MATITFPVVDTFQLNDEYYLSDSNYPINDIMSAIVARMTITYYKRCKSPIKCVPALNELWERIGKMDICATIQTHVGPFRVCIYRQDSGRYYELVMY